MAMDIKKMAEDLVNKIRENPQLLARFRTEPVKVVEELTGLDLPDAEIQKLAELIKARIDLDKAGEMLKGLGGLFKK